MPTSTSSTLHATSVFENEKSGVETITTNLPADGRMYDLMGREIREPQRGTVYIQDGRKKVKH